MEGFDHKVSILDAVYQLRMHVLHVHNRRFHVWNLIRSSKQRFVRILRSSLVDCKIPNIEIEFDCMDPFSSVRCLLSNHVMRGKGQKETAANAIGLCCRTCHTKHDDS